MTISSVSSNVNHTAAVPPQKQPASPKKAENNEGSSTAAIPSAPRPSVNTSGQVVGSKINTKA